MSMSDETKNKIEYYADMACAISAELTSRKNTGLEGIVDYTTIGISDASLAADMYYYGDCADNLYREAL